MRHLCSRRWPLAVLPLLLLIPLGCNLPPQLAGNPPPVPTPTPTASPFPTETAPATPAPTPCPVPAATDGAITAAPAAAATPPAEAAEDCQALYRQLLAEYGRDYTECSPAFAATGECPRPESLTTDLKETINIQLILDSSGSMAETIGGRTRLQIAQDVVARFVDTVPATANVALRVYGHTGSNSEADRAESCRGTELLYAFQPLDAAAFKAAIDSFQPTGWTPIAASLDAARQDFAGFDPATSTNLIYLVSDGIETCDGDPVAAARALNAAEVQAVVNVVGFAVDAEAAQQLRATAEAGGGDYFEARNDAELEQIFADRFDWAAWTAYYLCSVAGANRAFVEDVTEQNRAFLCVVTNANAEFLNLTTEINGRFMQRQLSDTCAAELRQQIETRRAGLVDAATNRRADAVLDAQQDRDAALQAVEDLRPTPTP